MEPQNVKPLDSKPVSSPAKEGQVSGPDVFEKRGSADSSTVGDEQADEGFVLSRSLQDPSEELPIELISLADRSVSYHSLRPVI